MTSFRLIWIEFVRLATKPQNEPITPKQNGPEWQILEKAVLASVEEQRRSRRWGIFFKTLTFLSIVHYRLNGQRLFDH